MSEMTDMLALDQYLNQGGRFELAFNISHPVEWVDGHGISSVRRYYTVTYTPFPGARPFKVEGDTLAEAIERVIALYEGNA